VLTILYGAFLLVFVLWTGCHSPQSLAERSKVAANVKL
jgi:hypothetical protein